MKLVQEYTLFRMSSSFEVEDLEREGDNIYFRGELVQDENAKYSEGSTFLNIAYSFKNSAGRVLSNLYPLSFKFRGKKVNSIEGVLQGIKYKDKKTQNMVLKYSGIDAYHTRAANEQDFWGNTQKLYWQGKEIDRNSNDYQLFLDELYISASKNPLYQKFLLSTGDKYLLHHIGKEDPKETVLTRDELEIRLNTLREFLRLKQK